MWIRKGNWRTKVPTAIRVASCKGSMPVSWRTDWILTIINDRQWLPNPVSGSLPGQQTDHRANVSIRRRDGRGARSDREKAEGQWHHILSVWLCYRATGWRRVNSTSCLSHFSHKATDPVHRNHPTIQKPSSKVVRILPTALCSYMFHALCT